MQQNLSIKIQSQQNKKLFLIVTILYVIREKTSIVNLELTKEQFVNALYRIVFVNRRTWNCYFLNVESAGKFDICPYGRLKSKDSFSTYDVLDTRDALVYAVNMTEDIIIINANIRLMSLILAPRFSIALSKEFKEAVNQNEFPYYEKAKTIREEGVESYLNAFYRD